LAKIAWIAEHSDRALATAHLPCGMNIQVRCVRLFPGSNTTKQEEKAVLHQLKRWRAGCSHEAQIVSGSPFCIKKISMGSKETETDASFCQRNGLKGPRFYIGARRKAALVGGRISPSPERAARL
jgi:hypothetical protein